MDNNHQQKCGMFRLCRRCLSGWALFAGDVVGVSMPDLPLAVLAAVDVGDAQGIWLDRHAVYGYRGVFEADRIGQVRTHACGDEFEAIGGAVGEPRPDPAEEPAHLVPSAPALYRPEH